MKHNTFKHDEVDAGHKTPCHRPMRRDGLPFRTDSEGYVQIPRRVDGRQVFRRAHRVRYEAAHGDAPPTLDHLCRNRWCCNVAHLEAVGTAENVRRGDCAKVDPGEVALMRVLARDGARQVDLAREFGLSQSHVSRLVRGLYWSAGPCTHWQQRKGGTQNL